MVKHLMCCVVFVVKMIDLDKCIGLLQNGHYHCPKEHAFFSMRQMCRSTQYRLCPLKLYCLSKNIFNYSWIIDFDFSQKQILTHYSQLTVRLKSYNFCIYVDHAQILSTCVDVIILRSTSLVRTNWRKSTVFQNISQFIGFFKMQLKLNKGYRIVLLYQFFFWCRSLFLKVLLIIMIFFVTKRCPIRCICQKFINYTLRSRLELYEQMIDWYIDGRKL